MKKTTMFTFDVGERGENAGQIVERLRGLSRMGFTTSREVIPAVAEF